MLRWPAALTLAALVVLAVAARAGAQTVTNPCEEDPRPPCLNTPPVTGQQPGPAREVGPRARSENFWLGTRRRGEFDISTAQLWYVTGTTKIAIPVGPDIHPPDPGDAAFGGLSALAFTAYKYIVHTTLAIVGGLVFGLLLVGWLLEPALRLSQSFQHAIIGPFELWKLVMAAAAVYFVAAIYLLGRPGRGIMDLLGSGVAIALMTLFLPAAAVRWVVSLIAGAAAVVLTAGTGQTPRRVPAPSTDPVDTTALTGAYQHYMGSLERLMVGDVAEILTFGAKLPPPCRDAYEQGKALGLSASDPANFKPFEGIRACDAYVNNAIHPDAERLFFAGALAVYGVLFAMVILVIAWPALRGTLQLMAFAAAHKFLFLAAALPGPLRSGALRAVFVLVYGVLSFVFLALILAMILLFMTAVFTGSRGWPMVWRLIAVLAIPFAFLFAARRADKAAKVRARRAAETVSRARPSSARNDTVSSRVQKLVGANASAGVPATAARTAAVAGTAGVGAAAGAAAAVAFGDDERRGVLLGPKTRPAPAADNEDTSSKSNGAANGARPPERERASVRDRLKAGAVAHEGAKAAHAAGGTFHKSAAVAGRVHREMADRVEQRRERHGLEQQQMAERADHLARWVMRPPQPPQRPSPPPIPQTWKDSTELWQRARPRVTATRKPHGDR